ncbi:ShlB/FhaC/HecB family hemolysin secretion/activation protein [Porphyrobacter sp. LM 6]|uniref:ShlB/FhaC/HecB family hemolysin secretion/activation protein n=1 Tax=Porphyrobacter sp. LM 6 TaxID=1896196 RepID=UPI000863AA90|nr:ShlB/FhaC/HecB family hemolysin secretion/activation protein [Porphyrobacter sp. LM 6]AOL94111.1 Hemolysin activation/secretion protein [Porphyrobacter sp. LM 6]
MRLVKFIIVVPLLVSGQAVAAQDALDRTNPVQQVDRERTLMPVRQQVRIDIQPVIDATAPSDDVPPLEVGSIVIDGLDTLRRSDFAAVIEPYAGRSLSRAELRQLTDQVADHARKQGYILATAWIPEQALTGGMLRIRVDEGGIDAIRLEGVDDPAVRAQLQTLIDQRPITLERLQRAVLLADDLPGAWIRSTRFENEGARRVLVVDARREDFRGTVQVSTDGTKPVAPVRARIDVDASGLLSPRDQIDLSYTMAPLDPNELAFFNTRYSIVVNNAGTRVEAFGTYSQTRPGAYLAEFQLLGEAWQGGIRVRHPVMRTQRRSLWIDAAGELQDLRQDQLGALFRQDRIALARVGLYGYGPLAGGTLRGSATLSQGLSILGATQMGDPLASRLDAEPDFTTFAWWASWERKLASRLSLSLAGRGQFSSAPLLIGESFTLGGGMFLRGYDVAQRVGDQGIAGFGELRYDWPDALGNERNLQLYAYADGGTVSNLNGGIGDGTLASSGGGLRADLTSMLNLGLEVAVPLTEVRYDTNDRSPRINLRVAQSF